ncbi:hypothetical protein M2451_001420 [Dysgonomonas sp. PFB1-18]|uniref:SH3 domain-containing protein n=1 Tax=unclassified Dysgonomonas TaxID=2630389 RepID=UPI00247690F5|nr:MULTISPECIES: SH3 domain-containing protein [unclassified Dysgonomonas]MDH6308854.1 hypothetical protein [Dysgonomonas sp. PF1-14]MDH6338450.1 hypothetical protein [Dysgonomonas sp. PF1-16]MDH6380103.1 hypothetical protein [Dysgonomonas sp. PFB1-18]MDH6397278.1 hypothetical protein [Dysgonomonas sp. PF1-23]
MKILRPLCIIFFIFFIPFMMYGQESEKLLSCSEGSDSEARCTGSAYCTACRNCSKCAHCNNGGSCGVCSGSSRPSKSSYNKSSGSNNYYNNYKSSKSNKSSGTNRSDKNYIYPSVSNNKTDDVPDDIFSEYYNKTLVINTETLNLRSGPGINYPVVHKLFYMQEVVFLAMRGDWIKVRVKSNNKVGYVHREYVLVKD